MAVTRELLNRADFNWAYSELFQNYDRGQIEDYLPEPMDISGSDGIMVHFAETHDNNRLAARSTAWARMRTALCALLSVQRRLCLCQRRGVVGHRKDQRPRGRRPSTGAPSPTRWITSAA